MKIRPFQHADLDAVAHLCETLWPDAPSGEHRSELEASLTNPFSGPYPCALFVADPETEPPIGFVQVGLRSHADGCDPQKPVGYVEGWFVVEAWRKRGVGRALVCAAENWAKEQGCSEMASDTWMDNEPSQLAHVALGFEVVDRCVNYRKLLR
jgi:aminoglycoside 6'-N-acetyltransferase I